VDPSDLLSGGGDLPDGVTVPTATPSPSSGGDESGDDEPSDSGIESSSSTPTPAVPAMSINTPASPPRVGSRINLSD